MMIVFISYMNTISHGSGTPLDLFWWPDRRSHFDQQLILTLEAVQESVFGTTLELVGHWKAPGKSS